MSTGEDVAARVDAEIPPSSGIQQGRGTIDRPALDHRRRVQTHRLATMPGVECAVGLTVHLIAEGENLAHVSGDVVPTQFTGAEAADLALPPIGAESFIHIVKP